MPTATTREWGVGASVLVRPNASGQGMTMNPALHMGATWRAEWTHSGIVTMRRSWRAADRSLATRVGARYDAELGYGLNALSGRNVLVPYVGAGFTDYGSRDYRMGVRLRSDSTMNFSFEVDRREGWNGDAGLRRFVARLDVLVGRQRRRARFALAATSF